MCYRMPSNTGNGITLLVARKRGRSGSMQRCQNLPTIPCNLIFLLPVPFSTTRLEPWKCLIGTLIAILIVLDTDLGIWELKKSVGSAYYGIDCAPNAVHPQS